MKNKIITLISLCFYQVFSDCSYYEFYQGETDVNELYIERLKSKCSSIQLTDKEKEIDKLNYKPDSCCFFSIIGTVIGPRGLLYQNKYFCSPARKDHIKEYLKHYGSDTDSDCAVCNGNKVCSSYFIKYYKFSLFLLFFLLLNFK